MTEIKRVGVLGCGLMGRGIAQISAQALARGVDETTLAHLQTVAGRINAVLNVSLSRTVR